MRANPTPPVDLDFIDGYLFRLMQEIVERRGLWLSGFRSYYGARLERRVGGLSEYDAALARLLVERYAGRRIVHAGIGIGTLACALACSGMTVLGIETMALRVRSARRLRAAIVKTWPAVEGRYRILHGRFPAALTRPGWRTPAVGFDPEAVLVFTNVAEWGPAQQAEVLAVLPRFAEVLLDLRLFGITREEEADRMALFDRLAGMARSAERLPQVASRTHLARFAFGRSTGAGS